MKFVQIPRKKNEHTDRLTKATLAKHMLIPRQVISFIQISPLINGINVQEIGSRNYWTTPITSYLKDSVLPDNKEVARKLKVQATHFILIQEVLYKKGFSWPYLRCLLLKEADYVMREVHKGVCGNHYGSRLLVHKLIRTGYYWPTMQRMPTRSSKLMTSARDLATSSGNRQRSSHQ